jgi:hypothetical protein
MSITTPWIPVSATAPAASHSQTAWAYEMRLLDTDAARAEAAALIEDRTRWQRERGLGTGIGTAGMPVTRALGAHMVGLYELGDEEDSLMGCLLLRHRPNPGRPIASGPEPDLHVLQAHTAPGIARAGWMMTMWLSHYAAGAGFSGAYAEGPGRPAGADPTRLLDHLCHLGWQSHSAGRAADGQRVIRLWLPAAISHGCAALIRCAVPTDREDAA